MSVSENIFSETVQQEKWEGIKVLRKNQQLRIHYPMKLSFKKKGKIDSFSLTKSKGRVGRLHCPTAMLRMIFRKREWCPSASWIYTKKGRVPEKGKVKAKRAFSWPNGQSFAVQLPTMPWVIIALTVFKEELGDLSCKPTSLRSWNFMMILIQSWSFYYPGGLNLILRSFPYL